MFLWSCLNVISIAFCLFYLTACGGGQHVCARQRLQEERGRQGALAAQASPSVSLPPLAPSATTEVVTRRHTAKRQTVTPRETRHCKPRSDPRCGGATCVRSQSGAPADTVLRAQAAPGRALRSRCTHVHMRAQAHTGPPRADTHLAHDLPLPTSPPSPVARPSTISKRRPEFGTRGMGALTLTSAPIADV